ncbi:MAG: hypothetical protein HRF50_04350 [Phycisphaerae bacterium]
MTQEAARASREPQAFVQRVQSASIRLCNACAALIDAETPDYRLAEARALIADVLMRSLGIAQFLRDAANGAAIPDERCCEISRRCALAFGAPGDWGGDVESALRALYDSPRSEGIRT